MDKSFVEAVVAAIARPQIVEVQDEERLILPPGWNERPRQPAPHAAAFLFGTLAALVDYLVANRDALEVQQLIVHVQGPSTVCVYGPLEDESDMFRRQKYVEASVAVLGMESFPFGQWLDPERAIIGLNCHFQPTPERDNLVALLSSIKESKVTDTIDNGVAQQQVVARGGVVFVGQVNVPSPVPLRPYRTFRDVAQPLSQFVVRMRARQDEDEPPQVAIFEADGGAWKLTAIAEVAEMLKKALEPIGVAVIA